MLPSCILNICTCCNTKREAKGRYKLCLQLCALVPYLYMISTSFTFCLNYINPADPRMLPSFSYLSCLGVGDRQAGCVRLQAEQPAGRKSHRRSNWCQVGSEDSWAARALCSSVQLLSVITSQEWGCRALWYGVCASSKVLDGGIDGAWKHMGRHV